MSAFHKADIALSNGDVRFAPESGHSERRTTRPLSAKKRTSELILTNMQRDRPDAFCYRSTGQRAKYTPVRIRNPFAL